VADIYSIMDARCVTLSATPTLLSALLTAAGGELKSGCARVGIQPISADAEWGWSTGTAPSSGSMGVIPAQTLINFENRTGDMAYLYLAGSGSAYVIQESI
jgi:hypothetical protein